MGKLIIDYELKKLLADAVALGIQKHNAEFGEGEPYMSRAKAARKYGRGTVDRWIQEGLIKELKDGNDTSKIRLDSYELALLAKTSNRNSYLTVAERIEQQLKP